MGQVLPFWLLLIAAGCQVHKATGGIQLIHNFWIPITESVLVVNAIGVAMPIIISLQLNVVPGTKQSQMIQRASSEGEQYAPSTQALNEPGTRWLPTTWQSSLAKYFFSPGIKSLHLMPNEQFHQMSMKSSRLLCLFFSPQQADFCPRKSNVP